MRNDGKVWFAGLVWVVSMQIAVADEWKVTGSLDQKVEYDDNIS